LGTKVFDEWLKEFEEKRAKIISKLKDKTIIEIIDYFEYDNMKEKEPDFCPLYKIGEKCHDLEYLNCFFCACPFYKIYKCEINSKFAIQIETKRVIDCSNCPVPHRKQFVYHYAPEIIKKILTKKK